MKIQDLFIEGFGHFASEHVGPFERPVTIIYGPNEAGKSTLLAFIRAVLFGFPPSTTHYLPPGGHEHGGRITLTDGGGNRFVVERFRGPRGGQVSLSTGDGAQLEPSVLGRILGQASSEVFKNVFAFSLDELQRTDSLDKADVDSQIYGAGIGAAKLPAALKSIGDKKAAIFRSRGKSQIADTLTELNEIGGKLAEAQANTAKYGDLVSKLSDLEQELKLKDSDLAESNHQSAENDRLRQGWEDWVALAGIDEQLALLPSIEAFPENAISRLEGFLEEVADAKQELEVDDQRLADVQKLAQTEISGYELLDQRDNIEHVRRDRNRFDGAAKDLPEREAELQGFESALRERLRGLGADWDEARLESLDTSISTLDRIEQSREIWVRGAETCRERNTQLDNTREELRERERFLLGAQNGLDEKQEPQFDAPALAERRAALRTSRTRLGEYNNDRQRHTNLRDQLESMGGQSPRQGHAATSVNRALPLVLVLIAILTAAAGAAFGTESLIIGGIAGALLIAVAGYILLHGRRDASGVAPLANPGMVDRVNDAEAAENAAAHELRRAAEGLGLGLPDAVELDESEGEMDSASRVLAEWETLSQRLKDADSAVRQQEDRVATAAQAHSTAQDEFEQSIGEWKAWLRERSIDESYTPEAMVVLRGSVETGRVELRQAQGMRHRIGAIEYDIQEFAEKVEPLAKEFGITTVPGNLTSIAVAADDLIERYDSVRQSVEHRNIAQAEAESIGQQVARRKTRLDERKAQFDQFLQSGGAHDMEEFRRRAAQHLDRQNLERDRIQHNRRLQQLSGPNEQLEEFKTALAQTNLPALEDHSRELAAKIDEISSSQRELLAEQGKVSTLIGQLTSEEESSGLRVKLNVQKEQLKDQAWEWSKLAMAEELLLRARKKYEEERQPDVIRHAQAFFGSITEGRYSGLYAPIGEQTVRVISPSGATKLPSELSRGTKEQLYLALRFGLIREFGEHAERLPVVVDEVLVNFDPERARRAAEAFAELAQTNQVLVFTCHPETVELFKVAAPDAQVITM